MTAIAALMHSIARQKAGLEKPGPDYRIGNCETGKRGTSVSSVENAGLNCMEHRKYKNEHLTFCKGRDDTSKTAKITLLI